MAWRLVLAFIALSTVHCKDLTIGEDGGNLIWTEVVSASPLIPWAKTDHVYVETDDENEFISKIVVIDKYPEKPGDVEILEGGVGEGDVLIEFSRKGIFRGFEFYVEVYSKHDNSLPPHKPHEHADKVPPKIPEPPVDASVIPVPKTSVDSASTNAPAPALAASEVPLSASEVPLSASELNSGSSAVNSSTIPVTPDSPIGSESPASGITASTPLVASSDSPVPPVAPSDSTVPPVASSDSTVSPVVSSDSAVTPFVNSADTQTALVGLVIPNTRVRRQVENITTTEVYDEGTEDYEAL